MFPTLLIIDDEPSILQSLSGLLTDEGFEVITASNGYEGLKLVEAESPDLVLLDIWMPGIDGIETLKEIKRTNPFIQVIIITGHGNIDTAVRATKLGAFNLIEKPLSIDRVIVDINNALNFRRLEEENRYLRKKTIEKHAISGHSPAVVDLKKQLAIVSPTDSWVLIHGENGVGKELVARTVHQLSKRAESPIIDINCASVSEDRLEIELFGHEKGAVAGSDARKRGRFEMANEGTLFLDEIGDMSPETQARLLRVLQEHKFQRIGGGRMITVDVRIIAATNKDLEKEIQAGRFREDLFYRINEIPIRVPALRERKEDIPVLAQIFLEEQAAKKGGTPKTLAPEVIAMLCAYPWPGNVRELKNLMGRLSIMVEKETITPGDIPPPYNPGILSPDPPESRFFQLDSLEEAVAEFEKAFIRAKVAAHRHDMKKAARSMGIGLKALKARLEGFL